MPTPTPITDTRERILTAAAAVVIEQGAMRMTLEAVAAQAGVSKGGLLYHFPSKDALVQAMIEEMNLEFAERIRREFEADKHPSDRGRWLRGLVRATFTSTHLETSAGLVAAVVLNPGLLDPTRRNYEQRQALIEQDGIDPVLATIIRLAADGLWFSDLLGLSPLRGHRRQAVMEALLSFTTAPPEVLNVDPEAG